MSSTHRIKLLPPTSNALRIGLITVFFALVSCDIYLAFNWGFFQESGVLGATPIPLWFTAAYAAILITTTALLAFQCWKVLPAPLSKVASLQASADAFLTEHIQRLTQGRRLTRAELGILATYRPEA